MCEVSSSICSSPIGRLEISYCLEGLHSINIINKSVKANAKQLIEVESSNGNESISKSCLNWLHNYFHSSNKLLVTPELCPNVFSKKKSFQENVWHKLLTRVPYGTTITYGQLAELSGSKKASRAVGTAMRRNPFPLIVPCHRVIRSNGDIGKYAGGEHSVKLWLIRHEQK